MNLANANWPQHRRYVCSPGRMVEVSVTSEWTRFQVRYYSSKASFRSSLDEQINHLQQLGRLDDLSTACIHEICKLGNKVGHQAMFPSQTQAAFYQTSSNSPQES
jgi:hypothetical protein